MLNKIWCWFSGHDWVWDNDTELHEYIRSCRCCGKGGRILPYGPDKEHRNDQP